MSNFMEKTGQTSMVAVEETREIAEIKAKMVLARQFPRSISYCMDNILAECQSPKLAEVAQYSYPKGGTEVKGASIRLIEVVARYWGNITSGVKELSRTDKGCTAKVYAWDLETNTCDEKVFDIAYTRNTKKGSYAITDEREKYELMANYAARRKRACLQALIPGYVIDSAIEECEKTLEAKMNENGKSPEDRRNNMLSKFTSLVDWVTPEMLASIVSKDFDKIGVKDLVRLGNLYNAIKDGFAKPEVVFGIEAETKSDLPSVEEESVADALMEQLGFSNGTDN